MEKEITGKVTGVAKQWWLKVNTKPIRLKFMDGAVFPHIIKVVYSVDGKEYTKRKWLSAGIIPPNINDTVKVFIDENKPSKAKIEV